MTINEEDKVKFNPEPRYITFANSGGKPNFKDQEGTVLGHVLKFLGAHPEIIKDEAAYDKLFGKNGYLDPKNFDKNTFDKIVQEGLLQFHTLSKYELKSVEADLQKLKSSRGNAHYASRCLEGHVYGAWLNNNPEYPLTEVRNPSSEAVERLAELGFFSNEAANALKFPYDENQGPTLWRLDYPSEKAFEEKKNAASVYLNLMYDKYLHDGDLDSYKRTLGLLTQKEPLTEEEMKEVKSYLMSIPQIKEHLQDGLDSSKTTEAPTASVEAPKISQEVPTGSIEAPKTPGTLAQAGQNVTAEQEQPAQYTIQSNRGRE